MRIRMSKTKPMALLLIAPMALQLLAFGEARAGGGSFPIDPRSFGFVLKDSGNLTAIVVLDPTGPVSSRAPSRPIGTFGSIGISQQNVSTAAATFRVEPDSTLGELRFGCNLLVTNPRFVELASGVPGLPFGGPGPFANWLSTDVTTKLFSQLGVTLVDPSTFTILRVPAIAEVISQKCVPFPKAHQTLDYQMLNEIIEHQHIKPLPPTVP